MKADRALESLGNKHTTESRISKEEEELHSYPSKKENAKTTDQVTNLPLLQEREGGGLDACICV